MYWSREMARLAQSQADYCASVGRMVHSDRYAFQGGENLCGGKGNFSPRTIVNSWLSSKAGHREYMLSPRVTKAGVGTARRNGKMFVAWAFSDASPSYPDCPASRSQRRSTGSQRRRIRIPRITLWRRRKMIRMAVGTVGLWLLLLGIHGLYVYFSLWEVIFKVASGGGSAASKLFLAIAIPWTPLANMVLWMTGKGFESWFIPLIVGLGGLWIMSGTGFTDSLSYRVQKWKLW